MKRIYWLATPITIRACHSIAQAVEIGAPGDLIVHHGRDVSLSEAKPSHIIVMTRNGKKRAVRLRPT